MFRIVSVAALALVLGAPALAQSPRELSGGEWSCRMTSLTGDQSGDMTLDLGRTGVLGAEFYFEVPAGGEDDIVSMHFAVAGTWSLNDKAISMAIDSTELKGGWLNGEELDEDAKAAMAESIEAQMSSFSGESVVAYVARHAMVLEEDETSISCWR